MGYRHFGVKTGGIPIDWVMAFREAIHMPIFIESGTAGGHSVLAVSHLFDECHTIEIVEGRSKLGEIPGNIILHTGNSPEIIPGLIKKHSDKWIFFWLDAHWSEPHESPEGVNECPVLDEIRAIKHAKSVIFIDDARLFLGPPPWPNDPNKWPKFKDVFLNLTYSFPDHIITVVDDYIVCIPQELKGVFFNLWRGSFTSRYPSDEERLKEGIKNGFEAFKKYIE